MRFNWKIGAIIVGLWTLLAIPVIAHAAPAPATAPAMAPATMTAAPAMAPAMRPAPRPVARPTARPAAMPAVAMAPPAATMETPMEAAMTPAPAMTPTMAPEQPTMAAAPDPKPADKKGKKDSKGSVIGGFVLELFLGILSIALPIVLTPVVIWLLKKMKVEDHKTQQMIDDMVDKAVVMGLHYAEEQAHKLRDNPVKSAEKLNMAADKAKEYLKDSKVVDKGAEYLKGLIEAKLGQTRNNPPTTADDSEAEEKPEEEKKDEKKSDDK